MRSNWGRWGRDDELGAPNLVASAEVTAACALPETGTVLSLAQPFGPEAMVSPHRRPAARFMDRDAGDYALGARSPDGFRFAEDTVQFATHSSTHMDALAHVWEGDTLYNGHPSSAVRTSKGAARCGADKLLPLVTRGILIDLARDGHLEPGYGITTEDLERTCRATGVTPGRGDAVLLRTGWWERGLDREEYHATEPGLTLAAADWLAGHDVALIGADNYAVEQQPTPDGSAFPVHRLLLHRCGIPLLENLNLRELSAHGAVAFLFVAAPLPLAGSTASPVAPVAVL